MNEEFNPLVSLDEEALGADIALTDEDLAEGGDLALGLMDIEEETGLTHYDKEVNRRLSSPKGIFEVYVHDPSGLLALDGEYGADYYRAIAEPSSANLFERIRKALEDALRSDPLVSHASVIYYVSGEGQIIFEASHSPIGGISYTNMFKFQRGELVPIIL